MGNKHTQTLVLIDAHAIIHRAYHALPEFSSSKGEATGALYGLATMLMKIIQELNPDHVAACYDLPKPTHRHDVFEEYKAGRAKADDALVAQLERSRAVFEAFGVPIYDAEGFEADDVLGTIVEQLTKRSDLRVVIASGDMDTLQLVDDDRVVVYTLRKGIQDTVLYDEAAVQERFGFGPELLPDYKGLRGDPSDNIPGVRGVGEKTATELITTFGSLEDIYEALEKGEDAFKSKGVKPRTVTLLSENKDEAFFSKMLATIRRDAPVDYALPKEVWRETVNTDAVLALFNELEFRTLGERFKNLLHVESNTDTSTQEEEEAVDEHELARTQIALWLLRSDLTTPTRADITQFTGTEHFAESKRMIFELLQERNLERVFTQIEEPLMPVIAHMNEVGVGLDTAYLAKLSKEYHRKLAKLEKRIYAHAGSEFNINSPKQLGVVLFDTLGLKPKNQKKTSTGQRSTKESELEKLVGEHEIIQDIFDYRELQKLLSTYIDTLPEMVGEDGRLHAEFLQAGTTTGRLASRNPNLQNIPIKSELGRRVRNAFVADKGRKLVTLDYSQIELRIAAILSQDEKLTAAFKDGRDIHTTVAADVFDVAPEDVTREMRRQAKVINFGILYGMGVNALRVNLGADTTTPAQAREFYDTYFKRYTGLATWIDHTKADAARRGYTETLFGRRRYFEGIQSHLPHIKAAAERMAINAPIQGTSADIIKKAMVDVDAFLREKRYTDVALVLQIHDELVYEMPEQLVNDVAPKIEKRMEEVLPASETHGVPIVADVAVGENWGEMEKLGDSE